MAAENPTPTITVKQFANQYGFAWDLISSNEELKNLFKKAVEKDWTDQSGNPSGQFYAALYNTQWWKKSNSTFKKAFTLENGTDATWQQTTLPGAINTVTDAAAQMGVQITDKQAETIARIGLYSGWISLQSPSQFIQSELDSVLASGVDSATLQPGQAKQLKGFDGLGVAAFTGEGDAASVYDGLVKFAEDNGLSFSKDRYRAWATQILDPHSGKTADDFYGYITEQAKSAFPGLSDQLGTWTTPDGKTQHQTIRQAADSYFTVISNTLGIDKSAIRVDDDLVKRVLQGTDPKENKPMSLYDAQKAARMDKRWMTSAQADSEMNEYADYLSQALGVSG